MRGQGRAIAGVALAAGLLLGTPAAGASQASGNASRVPVIGPDLLAAWQAPASGLDERVEHLRRSALQHGIRQLDGVARALLLEPSFGEDLERAEAAVRLAPGLPDARLALARSRWSAGEYAAALRAARGAVSVLGTHLEASIWFRASALFTAVAALAGGVVLFLLVQAGAAAVRTAPRLWSPAAPWPEPSAVALLASLAMMPAALGEGVLGAALGAAVLVLAFGDRWERVVGGAAGLLLLLVLHPLLDDAAEELVSLAPPPLPEAVHRAEHGAPWAIDLARLESGRSVDARAEAALALRARRAGRLSDADELYTALMARGQSSAELFNNAANVRLDLGRTDEAIALYERAATLRADAVILFNLSQAFGRDIQLEQQDLALQQAQKLDPDTVAELTELGGFAGSDAVMDLPMPLAEARRLWSDPPTAARLAADLRHRGAPGRLGDALGTDAGFFAIAALVALALGGRLSRDPEARGDPLARAGVGPGRRATDPALRVARLAAERARRRLHGRLSLLLSLLIPGVAGVAARRPVLGLIGALSFTTALAAGFACQGLLPDGLSGAQTGSLLFTGIAAAAAITTLASLALAVSLREGD